MITYNQEKTIAQAIESVLTQEVNFEYEIVVGEDCSTDNTRDIVIQYQKRYPDKFHVLLNERNLGAIRNDAQVYKACQGNYIAGLEGDDYWTSPHKLQKQAEFLDKNPKCSGCFHRIWEVFEDGHKELSLVPSVPRNYFTVDYLLPGGIIPTGAFMYRNGLWDDFPDWYYESGIGDYEQFIFTAQHGYIGYIDEVLGAYRTYGGYYTSSSRVDKLLKRIKMYENMNAHLELKYDAIFKSLISRCHYGLAMEYAKRKDIDDARAHLIKSVSECLFNRRIPYKDLIVILLKLYVPTIYKLLGFAK